MLKQYKLTLTPRNNQCNSGCDCHKKVINLIGNDLTQVFKAALEASETSKDYEFESFELDVEATVAFNAQAL